MNIDIIKKTIDSLINIRVINGDYTKKETLDLILKLEKELSKLLNNKQKTKGSYDKDFQNFLDRSLGRKIIKKWISNTTQLIPKNLRYVTVNIVYVNDRFHRHKSAHIFVTSHGGTVLPWDKLSMWI